MLQEKIKTKIYIFWFILLFFLVAYKIITSFYNYEFFIKEFDKNDNLFLNDNQYTFHLKTKNLKHIWLNGVELYTDLNGNIKKTVPLYDGLNEFYWKYETKISKKYNRTIMIFKK